MRATIRSLHIPRQTSGTLAEIAQQINPLLRGWIGYYGRFSRSALFSLVDYVNQKLKAWIMRKQAGWLMRPQPSPQRSSERSPRFLSAVR
jgi:hypothetical protein